LYDEYNNAISVNEITIQPTGLSQHDIDHLCNEKAGLSQDDIERLCNEKGGV
jgi:hypothetical protein